MNMSKKIELLAPSGNMEALKAAVAAGCDAVYLGGSLFSARAFAGNFNHEEMIEAVNYCHARSVKVYVTMNTLLFETEIENAMREVDFLYHADVDALLIQDLGLFHRIRIEYPDFELHCSTQMHIHNPSGCLVMKELGASRAVLARETPIEVVKQCADTGIDIEIFAYGALCISYSGQCLMSQSVKNRSGNRGMCAQMCRLKYYPSDGYETFDNTDGDYLLSPKDLNTIDRIPELIEAGVTSLKIEGRMKRPEYVWLVTHIFRKAIDAYYNGEKFTLNSEDERNLLLMFNRGFTENHLFHKNVHDRMSHYRPNHQGVEVGRVEAYENGRVLVKLSAPVYQHDGLRILNDPVDNGIGAERIWKKDLLVNHGDKGDYVWLECRSLPHPKKGQSLQKTSDVRLMDEIAHVMEENPRLNPITVSYSGKPGEPLTLTATDLEGHVVTQESTALLQEAKKAPLSYEKLAAALEKNDKEPYTISVVHGKDENIFMPVSIINETRRELLSKLTTVRMHRHDRMGHQKYIYSLANNPENAYRLLVETSGDVIDEDSVLKIDSSNKKPVVDESDCDTIPLSTCVITQVGSFHHPLNNVITGMNLNIANSYSLAFVYSFQGVCGVILSSELNEESTKAMIQGFESRYGFTPNTYKLVYGRRTLMYIKDRFTERDTDYLVDLQDRLYPVGKEGITTTILEPFCYRSENAYATGSYVILTDEETEEGIEIQKEAYEEIFRRI